jgi:hypothetical protein
VQVVEWQIIMTNQDQEDSYLKVKKNI